MSTIYNNHWHPAPHRRVITYSRLILPIAVELYMADQQQRIISSVFSRRNATGNLEESYVSHVKVWEDAGPEGGGRKPRYILLSRMYSILTSSALLCPCISAETNSGTGFIHKSKLNTNGTFSVGKTWRLPELRAVQVINVCSRLLYYIS